MPRLAWAAIVACAADLRAALRELAVAPASPDAFCTCGNPNLCSTATVFKATALAATFAGATSPDICACWCASVARVNVASLELLIADGLPWASRALDPGGLHGSSIALMDTPKEEGSVV